MATATARRNPVDKHDARRRAAGRLRPAHARRARLREVVAAGDRQQLRVHPRGRALLLRRQVRADRLLRQAVQGRLRDPLRRRRRRVDDAEELVDAFVAKLRETHRRRGSDAPPLVRPALPEHVRGEPARGRPADRHDARGDDLAGRHPLRRTGRHRGGGVAPTWRTPCSTGSSSRPSWATSAGGRARSTSSTPRCAGPFPCC